MTPASRSIRESLLQLPVGENRWRAPQPAENWEGTLDAFEFGPISMQDTPGIGELVYNREWHVDPEIRNSEDCLYLNIWTPAKKADEKLPVLVWIYGGGFQWGYTAEMEFNGEPLAERGVIVISIAYRLGCFGFMAHPEITGESPASPSNFGLLDQKAGLDWVKEISPPSAETRIGSLSQASQQAEPAFNISWGAKPTKTSSRLQRFLAES